jgi:cytochrome c peroxidase
MRRIALLLLGGVLAVSAQARTPAGPDEATPRHTTTRTLHLPEQPYQYARLDLPAHFRNPAVRRLDNMPRDNPITDAGATLGRVLFYDTRLSRNHTIACASCHQQRHAFADPRPFSLGHDGRAGDRNAMSLVEARYYGRGRFFWDERARTLEEQVLLPIQNSVEMGQDLNHLVEQLSQDPDYAELFSKAFGSSTVTSERIARALAQFVRSLVSYRSRYDEGLAQVNTVRDDFPNFTAEENRGKDLFLGRCAVCHLPPGQGAVFTLTFPQNNGLDGNARVADLGVGDVTFNPYQAGAFKSPSLRNVEVTGPYMHDGRLKTLADVIEHYSSGVKPHPNLAGPLRGPGGRRLDTRQKAALVAFLKTLTDTKFLTDPKFADPFRAE